MEKYKIKDICTVLNGRAYKYEELQDSGKYRILRVGNFFSKDDWYYSDMELEDNKYCNNGDLLYAWSANFGPKIWNGEKTIYHYHIWKIIPNDNVDKLFLYYKLISITDRLKDSSHGSVMLHLTKKDMENYEIELPTLTNQRKIGNILKNIDDKIELNNKINNNLYEEAVALYKDKFKGIGQGKKTIGDYIVPKRGKNLLTRDAINGDTPVVAGGIDPSAYHNQFNTKSPVITISASGANAGYTNLWNIPVWASDCSYIDDSITKNVYFWYIVLKTRQNEIFDAQTGSAQPHIYPQHIAEMSIGELNIAEVEKYNNLVAPLFKMIGENKKENKKLSQLRDTLLSKLMNGEINLDNIEI